MDLPGLLPKLVEGLTSGEGLKGGLSGALEGMPGLLGMMAKKKANLPLGLGAAKAFKNMKKGGKVPGYKNGGGVMAGRGGSCKGTF